MKKLIYCIITIMIIISLTSCTGLPQNSESNNEGSKISYEKPVVTPTATPTPEPPKKIIITAVGDIMFHSPQINAAFDGSKYDFSESFEDIKVLIESSDIAIGNFETTIHPMKKPSGYPRFNAPIETLDALSNAGFDVLITANNHSADTGEKGIINTAEMIKKYGMIPVGTGSVEQLKYSIVEKETIKVGFLAYTSSTNGLTAPKGMINILDLEAIKSDIEIVKTKCDFLVVYIHMGTEYVRRVEDNQLKLFREIADLGGDCILGSHPHVARKSEIYNTDGREVYINYSLGNFISNQNDKYTDIGTMVQLSILKDKEEVMIDGFEIIPTYRLRYKDGNKTIRKVILGSSSERYEEISQRSQQYIKEVSEEITELLVVE